MEEEQFLAVLSCDNLNIDGGLKNIINLTFNLPHYTLINDIDDFERAGRRHLFNIRGYLSASEAENKEWLSEEGKNLINSGKGIDTEYGKLFVNEEIPFEEIFKVLWIDEIHCHHKKPLSQGGTDEYKNLIIVHIDVHKLIHATKPETIQAYLNKIKPDKSQLDKINKLRMLVGNPAI